MQNLDLSPRHLAIYLAGVRGGDGEEGEPTPVASGVPDAGDPPAAPDAPPAPEPTNWEARVTEWGGEEAIADALQVAKALQDPEGVASLFVEAGRALGLNFDQINALFDDEGTPAGDPPPDPDAPVTAAQLAEAMKSLQEGQTQATEASNQAAAKVVVDAEVQRLGLDPDEVTQVLELGSRHLKDGDYNPESIRSAIAKGHAEWQGVVQKVAEKYLKQKQETRDTSPTPLTGGGSPGGSEEPTEPKDMDEAKARVRKALGIG